MPDIIDFPELDVINKTKTPRASSSGTTARGPRRSLQKPLLNAYVMIGMSVMTMAPEVGEAIIENAEKCSVAVNRLCQDNVKVYRIVDKLLTNAATAGVLAAHMPIIMAALTNYVPMFTPLKGMKWPDMDIQDEDSYDDSA